MRKIINGLFRSGRLHANSFDHRDVRIEDIDGLLGVFDDGASDDYGNAYVQAKTYESDSAPRPGECSIQRHSTSVEDHTDDVSRGVFFQCCFLWLTDRISTAYDRRPEFLYFDPAGKKHKSRISGGDSIIFNPRKPHSLIFYGAECTLALRAVVRQ